MLGTDGGWPARRDAALRGAAAPEEAARAYLEGSDVASALFACQMATVAALEGDGALGARGRDDLGARAARRRAVEHARGSTLSSQTRRWNSPATRPRSVRGASRRRLDWGHRRGARGRRALRVCDARAAFGDAARAARRPSPAAAMAAARGRRARGGGRRPARKSRRAPRRARLGRPRRRRRATPTNASRPLRARACMTRDDVSLSTSASLSLLDVPDDRGASRSNGVRSGGEALSDGRARAGRGRRAGRLRARAAGRRTLAFDARGGGDGASPNDFRADRRRARRRGVIARRIGERRGGRRTRARASSRCLDARFARSAAGGEPNGRLATRRDARDCSSSSRSPRDAAAGAPPSRTAAACRAPPFHRRPAPSPPSRPSKLVRRTRGARSALAEVARAVPSGRSPHRRDAARGGGGRRLRRFGRREKKRPRFARRCAGATPSPLGGSRVAPPTRASTQRAANVAPTHSRPVAGRASHVPLARSPRPPPLASAGAASAAAARRAPRRAAADAAAGVRACSPSHRRRGGRRPRRARARADAARRIAVFGGASTPRWAASAGSSCEWSVLEAWTGLRSLGGASAAWRASADAGLATRMLGACATCGTTWRPTASASSSGTRARRRGRPRPHAAALAAESARRCGSCAPHTGGGAYGIADRRRRADDDDARFPTRTTEAAETDFADIAAAPPPPPRRAFARYLAQPTDDSVGGAWRPAGRAPGGGDGSSSRSRGSTA